MLDSKKTNEKNSTILTYLQTIYQDSILIQYPKLTVAYSYAIFATLLVIILAISQFAGYSLGSLKDFTPSDLLTLEQTFLVILTAVSFYFAESFLSIRQIDKMHKYFDSKKTLIANDPTITKKILQDISSNDLENYFDDLKLGLNSYADNVELVKSKWVSFYIYSISFTVILLGARFIEILFFTQFSHLGYLIYFFIPSIFISIMLASGNLKTNKQGNVYIVLAWVWILFVIVTVFVYFQEISYVTSETLIMLFFLYQLILLCFIIWIMYQHILLKDKYVNFMDNPSRIREDFIRVRDAKKNTDVDDFF